MCTGEVRQKREEQQRKEWGGRMEVHGRGVSLRQEYRLGHLDVICK